MECLSAAVIFTFALFAVRFGFTELIIKLTRKPRKTIMTERHVGLKAYPENSFIHWLKTSFIGKRSQDLESTC